MLETIYNIIYCELLPPPEDSLGCKISKVSIIFFIIALSM
jgi:hypothetical protein